MNDSDTEFLVKEEITQVTSTSETSLITPEANLSIVMAINKLTTIAEYWRVDNLISNDCILNKMARNCFCKILQNIHFADNRKDNKTDKAFKMRPVIDHLRLKFSEVPSNDSTQNIDEHIVKFKD